MDLLHPNLLTNEQIMAILKERQLDISNIPGTDRDKLLRLYRSFIMPQPCRRTRERGPPENESTVPEKEMSRELKRKHNKITFTEDTKSKEAQYKVKRPHVTQEVSNTLPTPPKRRTSSEKSPSHNPHSKRKKITWP